MPDQYIVGVDFGSSKLCSTIAVRERNAALRYVGHGSSPSAGLRGGDIVAPDALGVALRRALEEARYLLGAPIQDIVASISGAKIEGLDRTGGVDLDRGQRISQGDVARAVESSRGIDPAGLHTIHRVVRGFAVDGEMVADPVGRSGSRLDVVTRDFAVQTQLIDRLRQAANVAGVNIHTLVPHGVAVASAALTDDDRRAGAAVVDIGSATTDIGVYINGDLRYLAAFPLGGHHITSDIAGILNVSMEDAERLKRAHGALDERSPDDELIEWTPRTIAIVQRMAAEGDIPPPVVRSIAAARAIQIIDRVHDTLRQANLLDGLQAGIVLTGGTAQLRGIDSIARAILSMPVRRGAVLSGGGFPGIDDPAVAASVGLARYVVARAGALASRSGTRNATANAIVHPTIRKMIARRDRIDVIHGGTHLRTRSHSRTWGRAFREWMREFVPARIEDDDL